MFLRYLTVVFLLVTAVKGTATLTPSTNPPTGIATSASTTDTSVSSAAATDTVTDQTAEMTTLTPSSNPPTGSTTSASTTDTSVSSAAATDTVTDHTEEMTTLTPSTKPPTGIATSASTTNTSVSSPAATDTVTDHTAEMTTLTPSTKPSTGSTTSASTTNTPVSSTAATDTGATTLNPSTKPPTGSTTSVFTTTPGVFPTFPATRTTTLTPSTKPSTGSTAFASTITKPGIPSTTPATGTTTLTSSTKPSTGSTASASSTTTTTTTTTPVSSTTVPVTGCPSVPCPPRSECLQGVCQCISSTFLQNGVCTAAQVFPGKLRITLTFVPEMADRSSEIFQETARNISNALFDVLNGIKGFIWSEVVKLEEGSVVATVNNIFQGTNVSETQIQEMIKNAANTNELFNGATYTILNLCEMEPFPCEKRTTDCDSKDGVSVCTCKPGYLSNLHTTEVCTACPSGQESVNNECRPCPFGYSGFNCNDSSLLAVVVVSCVLGGILLIMVLTSLICRLQKGPLKNSKIEPDDAGSSISRIPRATTMWDDDPAIEMEEGGNTYVMMDEQTNGWEGSYKPDARMAFRGKNPSQYTNMVQGHANPYYLAGDGKEN